MSELKRIVKLNELWGNYKAECEEELYDQLSLIEEEQQELYTAIQENDIKETVDALGDSIVVIAGYIHRLGYDPDKVMDIVNTSNESKMIDVNDPEQIQQTLKKYENDDRYKDIFITNDGVVKGTVVATGASKVLKGINYHPPKWEELDEALV